MNAAPFLVSFYSVDGFLSAFTPEYRDKYEADIRRLVELELPPVVSVGSLAVLFGFSPKFIHAMIEKPENYYRTFQIKKGKKLRNIEAPKVALKVIQKWIATHLSEKLEFGDEVCGFVAGRSPKTAALQHTNAKWLFLVDIKDFFPTTSQDTISDALVDLGYPSEGAKLMASLCCLNGNLAQGAPSSPVLSNLSMKSIDGKLKEIADDYSVRYTRYADDIVISGIGDAPEELRGKVKNLFSNTCWTLADEKEHFAELPHRLKVHGLLVHGDKPRLTKGYRNKIRAYKHLLARNKIKDSDRSRIVGHIKYEDQINK